MPALPGLRSESRLLLACQMPQQARAPHQYLHIIALDFCMDQPYSQELEVALNAVRQAAAACRSVQSSIDPGAFDKQDNSPVTVADFTSQALICRSLQAAFPEDRVIGEEGAAELRQPSGAVFVDRIITECGARGVRATAGEICDWIDRGGVHEYRSRFWTLDPVDGTKGFLRHDQYAISLALVIEGQLQVGVLGCPNMRLKADDPKSATGLLAWAVRGQGAWLQALEAGDEPPRRIHVSATSSSRDARFCESVESEHSSHGWSGNIAAVLGIHRPPFRIDSQCKYLAVARGDADLYLRLPTRKWYTEKIWDHAGGVLVVEEAGGRVTDIHGRPPEFHHGAKLLANEGMIVTNGCFHDAVVEAIRQSFPGR